ILHRREGEGRLRLVEASVDQAAVAAFWTGPDGRILRANHAAAEILGWGEEELPRFAYSDLDLDHPPGSWNSLWDTLKSGSAARFEARFRTKGGRVLRVEVRAGHVSQGDRECGFFLVLEAGSRGESEEALREANERLNLLTAVTRHDALNDIAALAMYLELMEAEQGDGACSAVPAGKLLPLVHSLRRRMEFTRDYAGLGAKVPGWEDVAGAVGRAVAGMDTGLLRVDLELPGLEVFADPLFERAVANLVDNTLRHGEHAGCIRFRAQREGDACRLIVEDDGVGIPRGIKEAIFRPGFGRHTGLGLYLIREILGITGMSITETGEPGKGARFEILVPPGGFRMGGGAGPLPGEVKMTKETRRTV
ncbi:MAG: ATP-binding protein, partial [Methanomicrobiales archaeon]|nr:ATP-binding protein [Methanomicrobiales archaeon]